MRISSIVTLTDDGTVPGDGIGVLHFDAMCPADGPKCLAAFDIERAKRVHTRLRQLRGAALGRMRSAIYYFDHISTGGVRSWQLAMLGGIACLEALFPQPQPGKKNGKKAWSDGLKYEERLANRVSSFLPRHLVWRSIREWLERVYKSHRNELAHGLHIGPFSGRSSKKRQRDQQRVLELARLCILGMLGKSNREISQLLPRDAREEAVQKALNDIGAAPAEFLRSQRRWA